MVSPWFQLLPRPAPPSLPPASRLVRMGVLPLAALRVSPGTGALARGAISLARGFPELLPVTGERMLSTEAGGETRPLSRLSLPVCPSRLPGRAHVSPAHHPALCLSRTASAHTLQPQGDKGSLSFPLLSCFRTLVPLAGPSYHSLPTDS